MSKTQKRLLPLAASDLRWISERLYYTWFPSFVEGIQSKIKAIFYINNFWSLCQHVAMANKSCFRRRIFLYSSLPGFYGLIGHKDFMSKRYASERSHTLCVNFFLRALPYTLLCSYGSWSIYYFSIHKQFLPEALRSLAHIRLYLLAGLWSPVEVLLDTDRQKIKVNKTEKTFSL